MSETVCSVCGSPDVEQERWLGWGEETFCYRLCGECGASPSPGYPRGALSDEEGEE
jgi:hypothetical protein